MVNFRIANDSLMEQAEDLMETEGFENAPFDYPTVVAVEGDEVVGFIGTHIRDDLILAGPLVLKTDRRRPFTAIRLGEVYEAVLRSIGITNYVLWFEEDSNLDRYFRSIGLTPYAISDGKSFYFRDIGDNNGFQPRRSRAGA